MNDSSLPPNVIRMFRPGSPSDPSGHQRYLKRAGENGGELFGGGLILTTCKEQAKESGPNAVSIIVDVSDYSSKGIN